MDRSTGMGIIAAILVTAGIYGILAPETTTPPPYVITQTTTPTATSKPTTTTEEEENDVDVDVDVDVEKCFGFSEKSENYNKYGAAVEKLVGDTGQIVKRDEEKDLLKPFCADPQYGNFDARGCEDMSSKAACETSVKNGWVPDALMCSYKQPRMKLGELDCIVGGEDICENGLVCTTDSVKYGTNDYIVRRQICMHPFKSREFGQSCLPFGSGGGFEHHSCRKGYCKRLETGGEYKCSPFGWGYQHGNPLKDGCRNNADCAAGLQCSTYGICYKFSLTPGDSCKINEECSSKRCKVGSSGTGWCEMPGANIVGDLCLYDGECETGCCHSGVCGEPKLCAK